jgi:RNA 2',3'-cyclic 3'-phosphodiesterase
MFEQLLLPLAAPAMPPPPPPGPPFPPAPPSRPLFDGYPQRTDVFLATYPSDVASGRTLAHAKHLASEYRLDGRPLGPQRFHATLFPIGVYADLEGPALDAIADLAGTIRSRPFDVAFDRAASFPRAQGKRPLVLLGGSGVAGLIAFQRRVEATFRRAGFPRWSGRRYNPHVTLLYDQHVVPERSVEPVRWRVEEFVLVRSLVGQGKHVPLKRWQLRG